MVLFVFNEKIGDYKIRGFRKGGWKKVVIWVNYFLVEGEGDVALRNAKKSILFFSGRYPVAIRRNANQISFRYWLVGREEPGKEK
jgi:hypothetical protein